MLLNEYINSQNMDIDDLNQEKASIERYINSYNDSVDESKVTFNFSNGLVTTLKNMFPTPDMRSAFAEMALRKELQKV